MYRALCYSTAPYDMIDSMTSIRRTKSRSKNTEVGKMGGASIVERVALPPLNAYSSRKEWEDACWRKIVASRELLQQLITSHERHDLVLRAVAMEGLASGKSYREIGKETWLSSQTISGIKKVFGGKEYRSYIERSKKERKTKKYNTSLFPTLSEKPRGRLQRTKYGTIRMP